MPLQNIFFLFGIKYVGSMIQKYFIFITELNKTAFIYDSIIYIFLNSKWEKYNKIIILKMNLKGKKKQHCDIL